MFKIVGVVLLFVAGALFVYGLFIRLPLYLMEEPTQSSLSFILSSIFLFCGLFFYLDIPKNYTRNGMAAVLVLGASFVLFTTAVVLAGHYYAEYDLEHGRYVNVPTEGLRKAKAWLYDIIYVYPYATVSIQLFAASIVCFVAGLLLKFRDSHLL